MRERELKVVTGAGDVLPFLNDAIAGATLGEPRVAEVYDRYFDTPSLRLIRWGATVRYRDGVGWMVKIPCATLASGLDREELALAGPPGPTPPGAVLDVVASLARREPLVEVAQLHTQRITRAWHRRDGTFVAELSDDRVTARVAGEERSFHEIEVELAPGESADVLVAVQRRLADHPEVGEPKLARAIGPSARAPADVVVVEPTGHGTAAEVVGRALARSVVELLTSIPIAVHGTDPEGVHRSRVAIRRLRSDLRTFGPLMKAGRLGDLRDELRWLGAELGLVRDLDVLIDHVHTALADNPGIGGAGVVAVERSIERARTRAQVRLVANLAGERAGDLYDRLVGLAADPPMRRRAQRPAAQALAPLVAEVHRALVRALDGQPLAPTPEQLHRSRILAKRVRYACDASSPALGKRARRLASAAAAYQDAAGARHDADMAIAWLEHRAIGFIGPAAFTAGRLAEALAQAQARAPDRTAAAAERLRRRGAWLD